MRPILLTCLFVASTTFAQRVPWTSETSAIASNRAGDPTFVFVPQEGVQLVVGTDTASNSGIYLWPPGQLPAVLPVGLTGSADARGAVLVVSSVQSNSLLVFQVADAGLTPVSTGNFNIPSPRQVALRQGPDGGFEVYVDTTSPTLEHYAMTFADAGVSFRRLRSINVPQTPSGVAVDDRNGRLYVSQPSLGILTVEPDTSREFLVSIDGGRLGSSVGGIDLYLNEDGGALLFTAAPNEAEIKMHSHRGAFVGAFRLGDVDGGSRALGQPQFLDVFEQAMPGFPRGVLVVQDELTANYKVVSLESVNSLVPLPPPFIPGTPAPVDAGPPADAGSADGGLDGGAGSDGGVDGGSMGTGGGTGGRPAGPAPGVEPMQPSCGCTGGPFGMLPALLLLWWIRRLRNTPS